MTVPDATRAMRILVATDGSNDAKAAVAWVRHLPLPRDREVMAITVVTPPVFPALSEVAGEFHGALIAEARRLADDTAADLVSRTATGRVVEGDPREQIVATARDWGADLVVLGARGLGAIKEFLLGSVSLSVARDAPCPVLVCKGTPREISTVTIGVDGSDHARRALDWLAALPLAPATRVRLVGVAEPQHYPSSAPGVLRDALRAAVAGADAERRTALGAAIQDAAAALRGRATLAVDVEVASGAPADVLVREAERHASDLVVVGARGAGALARLLLGSVSEGVLRHAHCPVLVVRPRDEASSL